MSEREEGRARFREAVRVWWQGTSHPVEHHGSVTFINLHPRRHWTSEAAHAVADFIGREWKWLFGAAVAIATLIIAAKKL